MTGVELIRQGDVYKCGDLALCPDPPEVVLVSLYDEWKKTGVLDWLWYGEPVTLRFYLNWFARPQTNTLGLYWTPDGEKWTPSGLCWINETIMLGKFKRAEVGMGYIRHEPPDRLLRYGQMCLEWGYQERGLDVIAGTTPRRNAAAVRYGKKLGFRVAGPLGGMVVWRGNLDDGYFQSLTKDEWAAISPFREQQQQEAA